jgi:hypothetical protein
MDAHGVEKTVIMRGAFPTLNADLDRLLDTYLISSGEPEGTAPVYVARTRP